MLKRLDYDHSSSHIWLENRKKKKKHTKNVKIQRLKLSYKQLHASLGQKKRKWGSVNPYKTASTNQFLHPYVNIKYESQSSEGNLFRELSEPANKLKLEGPTLVNPTTLTQNHCSMVWT